MTRAARLRRLGLASVVLFATAVPAGSGPGRPSVAAASTRATSSQPVADPATLVDPLDGTGSGPAQGAIGQFPGADLPFGMIQWSPETVPNQAGAGGGYSYADDQLAGFGLTNLSGTGCTGCGDVPILPTVGAIGSDPAATTATFSHAGEVASPGRYRVTAGGVTSELAVTTRTGLSAFTFPRTTAADVLFKVAGGANTVVSSAVHVVGTDVLTGSVTAGQFCGTGTNYTLYFAARFDHPFTAHGSWEGPAVTPGSPACSGAACGAWVTFDTTSDPVVHLKVAISYVSTAGALGNLAAEDPGWSLQKVETTAHQRWDALLGRIRIGGGTAAQQRTFYTALYHSLLFPSVTSDHSGAYRGDDGRIHSAGSRVFYANFSEWDVYRSEIELLSLLAPHQVGDMLQSLVDDASQGGWLPKWAIPDGDANQMNGDSADPIVAAAYAFGVHDFDAKAALRAMVKGANQNETDHGLEIERQYLDQYRSQHYVNGGSLDLGSITYSDGASATLEYAIDDFAVAQLADALGEHPLARSMMARAHNWEYLFDPATGYLGARNADGSFPAGPAFQTAEFEPGGEVGFEEGNAVQYTWSAPQDLAALAGLMGGDSDATTALDKFFTQLDASRYQPYDWSGNEPSLWTPWEYDYFGAPSRTQAVVRSIVDSQYADAPVDEPGNDDLGAISSWYVWAAIGLYPVTPGSADLALASPLFPDTVVTLPDGKALVEHAPGASAGTPYVQSLRITGTQPAVSAAVCGSKTTGSSRGADGAWVSPWVPGSILQSGATMTFALSSQPAVHWAAAGNAPPSFSAGRLPAVGDSSPARALTVTAGQPTTVQIGIDRAGGAGAAIGWSASATGLAVAPPSGQFPAVAACTSGSGPTQGLTVTGAVPGRYDLRVDLKTSTHVALPPVVVALTVVG
jgi:predicted alpha-1,2-mannosidase